MSTRGESGLSFQPKPRKDTSAGTAVGSLLLVAGLVGLGAAGYMHYTSSPVRNGGHSVIGTLIGYLPPEEGQPRGKYAEVTFEPNGSTITARSEEPVAQARTNTIGSTFKVYFDPKDPSKTFIEGIDQLHPPVAIYAAGGASLLLGIILTISPPGRDAERAEQRRNNRPRLRWR